MYELLAMGYEMVSGLIPFVFVLFYYKRKTCITLRNEICLLIFAVYIIGVFYITGTGTIYDAIRASFSDLHRRVNLIPFSREINIVGYALNIVMFLPLGFLAPLIFADMKKLGRVLFLGFGFSLLIEASQLLSHRGTDVDDLIMNTTGAVFGWMVYKIWNHVFRSARQICGIPREALPIVILAIFTGRFFLFNMLGLINLIYGF